MSFLIGMDLAFFKPRHRLVSVGDVTVKNCHNEERFTVTCFYDTGTLFMDGRFAPSHFTIGETLNWYTAAPVTDIDIEELYFDNSKINGERPAHAWEKRTFLLGHWKQYAKNDIRIRVVIRLGKFDSNFNKQNESVYLTIREDQTTTNNEQPPNSLIIQPFS
jgi:hypothetical protein